MKKLLLLLVLLASGSIAAQKTLNDYKYAVIPQKFDFLNEADKYKLNTYVKMYMDKYGFTTYFNDAVPMELANENCNKVFVDVNENNTVFLTKLTVVIRDCTGRELFRSAEGTSREKELKVAYPAALRTAFSSFDNVNYKYSESSKSTAVAAVPTESKPAVAVVTASPITDYVVPKPAAEVNSNLLFAQPIANGFQLVDMTPKVILKIKNTSMPNVFIAERDTLKGVMFQQNGRWIFEYYVDGKFYSEKLNVKF